MPSKALKNNLVAANEPIPQTKQADPAQVPNSAGGFSFEVSAKDRLTRFLVLGTDGGTFYVNEKKLTEQNVDFLVNLIKINPELVLNTTVEVSHGGRAYRNSAAIFVLSLLFKHADLEFKRLGLLHTRFNDVVRTSTHLFEFAQYVELLGGWSRSKRSVVANWYTAKTPDQIAYQAVKYRQRDGWTHRDLFRLSHPKGVDQGVGNFILSKSETLAQDAPSILYGFKSLQGSPDVQNALNSLEAWKNLPWEAVPTEFHKSPELWQKLFENGQLQGQALLRQITRLSKLGLFDDLVFARKYADLLTDDAMIARTRLHPIQYLLALIGHTEGQIPRSATGRNMHPRIFGERSRSKDWLTSPVIVGALNAGFYQAFAHVEPANKRTMIGLDISGSMSGLAMGIDLSCAQVGAAIAMTVARTEPYYQIRGFSTQFKDLGISANMSLQEVLARTENQNFGGTDCALPMEFATRNNLEIDTFVVITDSETWAGRQHPHQALVEYRQKSGIPAKMVVLGMTSTDISITDPNDRGMLNVCGADTSVPRLIADFSAGRI